MSSVSFRFFTLVLFLAFASAYYARDTIRLYVSPKVGLSPLIVLVQLISEEPGLTCPEVLIVWAENIRSSVESDCDPEDIPESFSFSRRSPIPYGPGDHVIKVTLRQGSRSVTREAAIHVGGD